MKTAICVLALLALLGAVSAQTYPSVQDAVAKLPELSMLNDNTGTIPLADKLRNKAFVGTLFAPTNSALKPIQEAVGGDLSSLLGDPDQVNDVFSTAVIPGKALTLADLEDGMKLKTLNDDTVDVKVVNTPAGKVYYINQAVITTGNIKAGNAIIHEMSSIVVPEAYQEMLDALVTPDPAAAKPATIFKGAAAAGDDTATTTAAKDVAVASKDDAEEDVKDADGKADDADDAPTARELSTSASPAPANATAAPAAKASSASAVAVGAALLAAPALLAVLL